MQRSTNGIDAANAGKLAFFEQRRRNIPRNVPASNHFPATSAANHSPTSKNITKSADTRNAFAVARTRYWFWKNPNTLKHVPKRCRLCVVSARSMEPHQFIRRHEAACKVHVCPQCKMCGSKVQILAHMRICRRTVCSSCGYKTSLDEDHHCQVKRCIACGARVHKDLVDKHMSDCPGWIRTWNKVPLRAGSSPASGAFLSPETEFPLVRECVSTMAASMKYPANTAIADFEFITFPSSLRFPCQVAIADGYGEWIIAPATINHGVTKCALLDRIMSIRARSRPSRSIGAATVHTYYPRRQDDHSGQQLPRDRGPH